MKNQKSLLRSALLILAILGLAFTAAASDAIQAGVTPVGSPVPLTISHGAGLTPGTYAVGTIQMMYTVNAYQFPAGDFAQFRLDLLDVANAGSGGSTTSYPVNYLTLRQAGSANLVLSPSPVSFSVTGTGWSGSSLVTISIPSSVPLDPSLNVDGAVLVGNLQMETPSRSHLDTVTTIQVKIRLLHPTSCLRVYHFITDEEFNNVASAVVRTRNGSVISTSPGQFSDNVLVVNQCGEPESFDLRFSLDPSFRTNPQGNPGNAVFTYFTTGEVNPATFNIAAFGDGTKQGQQLSLSNITVPAGQTFLATVHMAIQDVASSTLPTDGTFDYSVALYSVGSALLHPLATPNPALATQAFTVNTVGR